MYRRTFSGIIQQGRTRPFLEAMREARELQINRGIRARITIWGAMTGETNSVLVTSDFNTLEELEKFTEMAARDSNFAESRRAVSSEMVFETTEAHIHRLSYHSEGLVSSEDATAPRRFMRTLTGEVQPGHSREFVMAISQSLEYQKQRGIDATTSVWSAVTGPTSGISVIGEFDTFEELARFDELGRNDEEFARLRKAARENMVFLTSEVEIYRNLL